MISLDESYAYCRSLAKRTAGNFYFSFLTLRREHFRAMCALYGFMRVSDDLGDDRATDLKEKRRQLHDWRTLLDRTLKGDRSGHPVLPALADIVERYTIPPAYLHDVIDGVESDLEFRGFDTFEELERYCYRVAGAVGLCCLHVWGFSDERAIDHGIACGTAFQLTNILRDLGEDAAMGRCYLPRDDLRQFGVTEEQIANRHMDDRFRALMTFEVQRARTYYDSATRLFDLIERPGKPILYAMMKIYGGLLDKIEKRRFDVFSRRISLSRWRKLGIAAGAIVRHRLFRR